MHTAVIGAGSLGTIVGALISRGGIDAVLVDANLAHVEALNREGARITGRMELSSPVKAVAPGDLEGTFDLVIYLAKSTFDDEALPLAAAHMRNDSTLITLQNGVPEEKVASIIGRERTVGGAVGWGATWIEPGVSELTSDPQDMTYDIGELDGEVTTRLQDVKAVLDHAGKAILTSNLVGVRWTKLLVNVAMSGLSTVLDCNYGEILDDERASFAAVCVMLETIRTAQALGITMEPMKGVDPSVILEVAREHLEGLMQGLKVIYGPHRLIVGSMLQDLKKGQPCEVEALNGYLSAKAEEAGVATPVNDQVTEFIRRIEAGEAGYGFSNLGDIALPEISVYY
jgi:2-dehydropantoate 2-reductase